MTAHATSASAAVSHLQPAVWAEVNRKLVAKAIAELAHELLLAPEPTDTDAGWTHYVLQTDRPEIEYHFRAQLLWLDHWHIDATSVLKYQSGKLEPVDALRFIVELRERLAISEEVLPEYLEDLASTLYAAAWKAVHRDLDARALAFADFQAIEVAMTEGHPCFIANSGRVGWSAIDHARYAPEAGQPVKLIWLAAHRSRAKFACIRELTYAALLDRELGPSLLQRFERRLRERGVAPAEYVYLPVHPWQWENKLAHLFAADLASQHLIELGPSEDRYLAQQSIRTFFDIDRTERHYVKTALSIRNMGFTRGMPTSITAGGAAVNDWVSELVHSDAYLAAHQFRLLREVAFIAYPHRYYEVAIRKRADGHKEMLAALWRENPTQQLGARQRAMTMAALLHRDRGGSAVLPVLIQASGASADGWIARFLHHYLKPLLHAFYAHNLVFTPHCENTILVLEDNLPVGVFLKDLAEDIGVLNPEQPLPAEVKHLALRVPDDVMTLAIFTDAFDCVFRFLAPILHEHLQFSQARFWRAVAQCIHTYRRERPELAAKLRRYDLFAPTFRRNCLNRLQLRDPRMMVDLNAADPVDSLQFAGELQNPIAAFRDASMDRLAQSMENLHGNH
jgi:siderophore synthetase component